MYGKENSNSNKIDSHVYEPTDGARVCVCVWSRLLRDGRGPIANKLTTGAEAGGGVKD